MHFILLLLLYFLLVIVCIALILFPDIRNHCITGIRRIMTMILQCIAHMGSTGQQRVDSSLLNGRRLLQQLGQNLWRHKVTSSIILLLLIVPSLIAIFQQNKNFYHLEQSSHANSQVLALLQGERLSPPAPLPPEIFTTREVELIRPQLVHASRDWTLLDPDFQQRLLMVYQIMKEQHGYEMVLIEGYRSPERQNELAAQGSHVTNARAYQSYHQFGLAADSAFLHQGKIVIDEKDPWAMKGYELYGETAEKLGLVWGGRWKMMDFGHVELRKPNTQQP